MYQNGHREADVAEGSVDVRLVVPPGEVPTSSSTPSVEQPRATPSSGGPLPRTGADVVAVVLLAVLLVALGWALLTTARRRTT